MTQHDPSTRHPADRPRPVPDGEDWGTPPFRFPLRRAPRTRRPQL